MQTEFTAVIGATASGKSALAVELAKRCDGEIVSCDSMQIYKRMNIGTAKPTESEMCGIPHHMIDIVEPWEEFSAGDYAYLAGKAITDITSRKKVPIMCGGTFLYLDAMTTVSSLSESSKDETLRAELEEYARCNGTGALHEMLRKIDPHSADSIHPNNVKRVIRAIEIFRTSGKTKTEWDLQSKYAEPPFKAKKIMIDYKDRGILYDRINSRVDLMMEQGLEEEVFSLYEKGFFAESSCASQAIGYKEFIPYFKGDITIGEVVETIKQSSRNYAKRQLTWLKRYKDAIVLYADSDGSIRNAASLADETVEKSNGNL